MRAVTGHERIMFDLAMALRSLPAGNVRDLAKLRRSGDDLAEQIPCDRLAAA